MAKAFKFTNHACHLLVIGCRHPPWTFLNLFIYAIAPTAAVRRGSYASMWATLVCFYYALLLDPTWHKRLMEKQHFSPLVFYLFDALVHWLPLAALHVPYQGAGANATGLLNLLWGVVITGGTMDLSEAYVALPLGHWHRMWMVSIIVTLCVPV